MVSVNITSECNQKCIYCEIGQGVRTSAKGSISTGDMKWILDQMEMTRIPKLSINGGEPFLFNDIIDVVEYAWKKNIRCTITTNGMTLYQLPDKELKIIKDSGTEINISVDSFNNEINAITRGTKQALPNALKSIKRLVDNKIPVTVLTAISRFNYLDLYSSVAEAYELGVSQMLFQPIIYSSNYPDRQVLIGKSNLNINPEQIDELKRELKKILKFEKKHKIDTNIYRILPWIEYYIKSASSASEGLFFQKILKKFYCREVDAIIEISYDGSILPCGLAPANGNIHNGSNLMKLWSNSTAKLRNELKNDRYPGFCNACCHHFSRNMFASIMKYPVENGNALAMMLPAVFSRAMYKILKNVF